MAMNLQFFGHNCFIVGGDSAQVIIDPWLSEKGAFYGSWYQWPINHFAKPLLIDKAAGRETYVYISHEHQDHFDTDTLAELKRVCSKALIPSYYDKYLRSSLEQLGFTVTELPDGAEFNIAPDFSIRLLIVDTGVNHDSAALIKVGNELFINQNDCKIFDRLHAIKEPVTYYAVQFSGATWHPVSYTYTPEEKREISRKKVASKLVAIKNMIRHLQPKFYFPSAGPAIFPHLDAELSLGEGNIFIHQPQLDKLLKTSGTKLVYLRPGEIFESHLNSCPIPPPTRSELVEISKSLPSAWEASSIPFSPLKLTKAIQLRLNQVVDLKFETCPKLILNWGHHNKIDGISIDLNAGSVLPTNQLPSTDYMLVSASQHYFALMSDPKTRWQDLYLTLRASVTRIPDMFNTFLNIFLFSDVENIRKAFQTTLCISEDRIVKLDPHSGRCFEINRFCPHNGADLLDADIDPLGNLICPRHAWKFQLNQNGRCAETGASIKAAEVVNTITLCESISARLTR